MQFSVQSINPITHSKTITSYCSTDTERPHHCCHILNKVKILRISTAPQIFPILYNGLGKCPLPKKIAPYLGRIRVPPNTGFLRSEGVGLSPQTAA